MVFKSCKIHRISTHYLPLVYHLNHSSSTIQANFEISYNGVWTKYEYMNKKSWNVFVNISQHSILYIFRVQHRPIQQGFRPVTLDNFFIHGLRNIQTPRNKGLTIKCQTRMSWLGSTLLRIRTDTKGYRNNSISLSLRLVTDPSISLFLTQGRNIPNQNHFIIHLSANIINQLQNRVSTLRKNTWFNLQLSEHIFSTVLVGIRNLKCPFFNKKCHS